ncbi:putative amino acid transporter, transmembrane domain-containing protein [Septoria linicola]|nr:putative amino acid transporter, transmembrane domain-containing protein [Septoria linicola]
MSRSMQQKSDHFDQPDDAQGRREKDDGASSGDGTFGVGPPEYARTQDGMTGEVYDPYGGKKLGMMQTTLIFFTNQVGIGNLSLPSFLHTVGMIPGIFTIVIMGILATYTAYILIQFYRRYPTIRDVVDVGRIMGGLPLEIVAGWFGIPATISIFAAVLIVIVALAINGPDYNAVASGGTGFWGEPPNEPLIMRLGPNSTADFRQQFDALLPTLNVAFAYAGNQAFITVMCEMRNPSKDYTRAIVWLNVFAIPMYVIVACVIYALAGQYVVSPALGSAPGIASKVAYGILFPTLLGSSLVFGHTAIKHMYNVIMDRVIKTRHGLTDNTPLTWGVWLGLTTII